MASVQYKTPGVFIEEIDAFPPSIVGVETAVPVFIGYTQTAERNGRGVQLQPVRIGSMVDYRAIFGEGAIGPKALTVVDDTEYEGRISAREPCHSRRGPRDRVEGALLTRRGPGYFTKEFGGGALVPPFRLGIKSRVGLD